MVEGDPREKELRFGPGSTMTYSMYALNFLKLAFVICRMVIFILQVHGRDSR